MSSDAMVGTVMLLVSGLSYIYFTLWIVITVLPTLKLHIQHTQMPLYSRFILFSPPCTEAACLSTMQPLLGEEYPFYQWFPKREYGIMAITVAMILVLAAGSGHRPIPLHYTARN